MSANILVKGFSKKQFKVVETNVSVTAKNY